MMVTSVEESSQVEIVEPKVEIVEPEIRIQDEPMKEKTHHQFDYSEIASSSKDTEYSTNPQHKEQIAQHTKNMIQLHQDKVNVSDKISKRRQVNTSRNNITMNLRQENERANTGNNTQKVAQVVQKQQLT